MRTVKHIYYPRDIGSPIHGSAISFQILNDRTRHQLPATISSVALDSGRWSLDLLLRPLLKYQ
jgi:hypothetical protein